MPETLTESFCERCGTRYQFRAPTRLNPLRKTRGFVAGLRNYIMSQDALGDSLQDAMRSEEEGLASAQLDAFHEAFNFCIGCRQYTCLSCWNDAEGRCRTCAPMPGDDLLEGVEVALPTTAEVLEGVELAGPMMEGSELQRRMGLPGWSAAEAAQPTTDGRVAADWPAEDEVAVVPAAEIHPEPEPVVAEVVEPEPVAAEAEIVEPEPVVAEVLEPEPVAAEAMEPEPAAAEAMEPEPVAAEVAEPVEAEVLEPVVAEAEVAEPEPVAAEPEGPIPIRVAGWDEDITQVPAAAAELEAEAALEPEPLLEVEPAAAEISPVPEPETAPQPVALEPVAEAEPEPAAPTPATLRERPRPIAPVSETVVHLPRPAPVPEEATVGEPAAAVAETPELAARRAQLDLLGLGDPGQGPVTVGRPNVLPYRSRGAAAPPPAAPAETGVTTFWEASVRELAHAAGGMALQNCGQCGLSLSASARFCRRCGQRQARSA